MPFLDRVDSVIRKSTGVASSFTSTSESARQSVFGLLATVRHVKDGSMIVKEQRHSRQTLYIWTRRCGQCGGFSRW